MYKIELIVDPPQVGTWGEFRVLKGYKVTSPNGTPANGYIIQKIDKMTNVSKYVRVNPAESEELGKRIRKVVPATEMAISEFTSGQVRWANHSYYEIFPILNGVSIDRDQFQNGAVLGYEKEGNRWFANDDPLTSGTIEMIGTNVFVPGLEEATRIQAAIDRKDKTIEINGAPWTIKGVTPANGIPYRDNTSVGSFVFPSTPAVVHKVTVTWSAVDRDGNKSGETNVVSKLSGGKRRKRTTRGRAASKSYRKQRTGTSTRRLRGRV